MVAIFNEEREKADRTKQKITASAAIEMMAKAQNQEMVALVMQAKTELDFFQDVCDKLDRIRFILKEISLGNSQEIKLLNYQ